MYFTQSNTQTGAIPVLTAQTFVGLEGRVCVQTSTAGTVDLPSAATDVAQFIIVNVIDATHAEVLPITSATQCRIVVGAGSSAIVRGSLIVGYGGTAAGQAFPWASGAAFIIGVAEEAYSATGQYLLVRPLLSFHSA